MAKTRTYKRDAKGRFAGGGAKDPRGPAKVGRAGPRGGKTGTRTQQEKAKQAQQSRTQQFQSKTQASSARDAYKAAARGARLSQKNAIKKSAKSPGSRSAAVTAKKISQKPRRLNRSINDQRHRDRLAKELRSLEKPVRRAIQIRKTAFENARKLGIESAGLTYMPPLTGRRGPKGSTRGSRWHTTQIGQHIDDSVALLMNSPKRGRNKLTAQQRSSMVADIVRTAQRYKARANTVVAAPGRRVRVSLPSGTIRRSRS